mmetsp:Transcript_28049/g.39425  ORF Transcript_28049/g.39425 Transcript_28049/m.39425 type:complete len:225 (+) Transcript_28049:97-771(+)
MASSQEREEETMMGRRVRIKEGSSFSNADPSAWETAIVVSDTASRRGYLLWFDKSGEDEWWDLADPSIVLLPDNYADAASIRRHLRVKNIRPKSANDSVLIPQVKETWYMMDCPALPNALGTFDEEPWWDYSVPNAIEKKVMIVEGKASLLIDGPDDPLPVQIKKGQWVSFRRGFQCTWRIDEALSCYFQYFDKDGNPCSTSSSDSKLSGTSAAYGVASLKNDS